MFDDIAVITNKSLFSRHPKGFSIKPDTVYLPVVDLLELVKNLADVKNGYFAVRLKQILLRFEFSLFHIVNGYH